MLIPNARLYAARHQLELAERLGFGKDGTVMVAKRKDKPANVAIKILRFDEHYLREKRAYQRLGIMAVTAVLGFHVPQLFWSWTALCCAGPTAKVVKSALHFLGEFCSSIRPVYPPRA